MLPSSSGFRRTGALFGLLAVCGLCAFVGTNGGIGGAYELVNSRLLSREEVEKPTLLLTATGKESAWASDSELQELACLARIATKQLAKKQELAYSVRMTPELSRNPEDLMSPSMNPSEPQQVINIMDFWTPSDPSLQAAAVIQRIAKTKFSNIVIPVFLPQPGQDKSKAFLEVFRSLAAKTYLKVTAEVHGGSAEETLLSLLDSVKATNGDKVVVLLVGDQSKMNDLIKTVSSDKRFDVLAGNSIWMHPNGYNFAQSLEKDSPGLKFFDQVGFSTTLYHPQANFTDDQLRKFKFILESETCEAKSVQRAYAFVNQLEKALKNIETNTMTEEVVPAWQAWNLFVAGLDHQHMVHALQDSNMLLDETLTLTKNVESSDEIMTGKNADSLRSEVVRKDHLLQVYSPIAMVCEAKAVQVDSWDPFTLEKITRKFENPGKTMPQILIIPSNNGFTVTLSCQGDKNKLKAARITCSGYPHAPCVHSAFKPNAKRTKRGISQVRQLLAALDSQRSSFAVGTPFDPHAPVDANFQKRMSSDAGKNETAVEEDYDPDRVPYRVRQKAALVYKVLYDQGLNSDQMLKAIPTVVASPPVRKEAERLIKGLPDTRMLQAISSRQNSPSPAKPPKYPLPPYGKWLLGSLGAITACIGTSTGALLCTLMSEVTGNFGTVAACHHGGFQHIGGSCMVMMGRMFQAVADDNSVICSALHSKGLLDDFSFVVDSAYGHRLKAEDPLVLDGYHFLAKPVANLIKQSDKFSRVMNVLSRPWIDQMLFESGYLEEQGLLGKLVLDLGVPVARAVGKLRNVMVLDAPNMSLWAATFVVSLVSVPLVFSRKGSAILLD